MRPIHLARLEKTRPVVILTRERIRPHIHRVTVAPITTTIRGLRTEVEVGLHNGLERNSVITCDNIVTMPRSDLGRMLGYLLPDQEQALARAIMAAFDLEPA